MYTAYTNGKIFTGNAIETNQAILVENNVITGLVSANAIPSQYTTIHNINALNIAPAFIDLQIYGGNGKLFSHEPTVESIRATYEYCLTGGCSQFMITMATNTIDKFLDGFEAARAYWSQGGKGLLGIHLEGPYINREKKGAHIEDCIKVPAVQEISLLLEKGEGVFKMMTLAPEICEDTVIKLLQQQGIILSAGHSNATYSQAMKAFDAGIPAATHLYNAMSGLHHRSPGMVGAVFNHSAVRSSIVCDGIHADYAAVAVARKIMQERLFFITDAVTATGSGEYRHLLSGDHYVLPDGTLSGSALTMMQCVKNGVQYAGILLEDALRMAATWPAQLLTGKKRGKIEEGYQADLVVFDDSLRVHTVYC